ncbi:DNA repair protein RadC [Oxalobacteraceae bacterium GrIS 1.11]
MTARLASALALVDVRVLDHFIVAGDRILSFSERGLL